MSKQASPPPPGDKPKPPSPPPPPPAWRHWLIPAGILVALFLWIWLPAVHSSSPTSLNYTQFLNDVSAHMVKTITIAQPGGTSTGTLTNGTNYTVVIPSQAGPPLLAQLTTDKVQITSSTSSPSFGSELLDMGHHHRAVRAALLVLDAAVPGRGGASCRACSARAGQGPRCSTRSARPPRSPT